MSVRTGIVIGIVLVVIIVGFVLVGVYGDQYANFSNSFESSNSSANPSQGSTASSPGAGAATEKRPLTEAEARAKMVMVGVAGKDDYQNHPKNIARNKAISSVMNYIETPDLYSMLNQEQFRKHQQIQFQMKNIPKKPLHTTQAPTPNKKVTWQQQAKTWFKKKGGGKK